MGKVTEGSLAAPVRHPIDWQSPDFNDEAKLMSEMERVFDLCHGCRRCVSLCDSFPTLFDLVDESATMEVDGVAKQDYWKVVDQCYLCDLCYMTKCPYVPPHEWNIDFPHLMLRAKAVRFAKEGASTRDKLLTSTDFVGNTAGIPGISIVVNAANRSAPLRKTLEKVGGIHHKASIPRYESKPLRKRVSKLATLDAAQAKPTARTKGKVALFATCYGNRNDQEIGRDTSELQSHSDLVCRLLLEKKKQTKKTKQTKKKQKGEKNTLP